MDRKAERFVVPSYIFAALSSLRPPENLTVSGWAEKYRRLDQKTSSIPGKWKNSQTPYLVGIMDEFNNPTTERINICKPHQVGGTEVILNMLGYIVQQDPSPTMVVYPEQVLAESVSTNRIKPMIQLCPDLRKRWHETSSLKLELQFDDMYLYLTGSNSPSGLSSRPMKYLFFDETDKFPALSGKEADPIRLGIDRTTSFKSSRKIVLASTPVYSTGHIWRALQSSDIEKHYFVPCPHCGEYIELKWSQVKFPDKETGLSPSERADQAVYACQECGAVIMDHQKQAMIRDGEWRIVRESNTVHRSVGFWFNALYSPFVRFSDAVLEFLKTKDYPEELQDFVNSWLAEPWEDTRLKTNADIVLERQTECEEFEVPVWAKLLTGGVDVQETCFYWTIRAWGDYITSQNICHGQADTWEDITRVMNLEYRNVLGDSFIVDLCLIDAGYNTDATYDYCADNADWAAPVMGNAAPMSNHFKLSKVNRPTSKANGTNMVLVDTNKYKDMIAARMKKDTGSKGSWMVYKGCDQEYANQVTSEHKINKAKPGQPPVLRWEPKHNHAANHFLDCEVYALAAADIRGVRSMHLEHVDEQPQEQKKQPAQTQYAPEEAWISKNDNWI